MPKPKKKAAAKPAKTKKVENRGRHSAGSPNPPGTRSIAELTGEEMAELRRMFEAGAKRDEMMIAFRIPFGGIYAIAAKDGWFDPKTGYAYKQQVKDDEAEKRAEGLKKLSAMGIPTSMEDVLPPSPDDKPAEDQFHAKRNQRRAAVLIRHISEWDELDNIRRKALEGSDPKVMFDWAKLAKITHETLMIKQIGERIAHNIQKGETVDRKLIDQIVGQGSNEQEVEVYLKATLSVEELQLLHSVGARARHAIKMSQAGSQPQTFQAPQLRDVTPKKDDKAA